MYRPGFSKDSYTPKEIYASEHPRITRGVTIAAGQVLERGALLGKVTASGAYVLSVAAAEDGSQTPVAVLADDVNASAAADGAVVYEAGHFEGRHLTYGAGHTADSVRAGLRTLGIYIQ